MFVQVTALTHWKKEHNRQTNEDAWDARAEAGMFAVADGAGGTMLSNIWAQTLVKRAFDLPLLSNDPYEVEWWVRQAQEEFKRTRPEPQDDFGREKMRTEGSYSTLITLRILGVAENSAQAELLAIGDSCAFIARGTSSKEIESFPLKHVAELDSMPILLSSNLKNFHRNRHRFHHQDLTLQEGDCLIMTTDAVAKWIMSGAQGRCQVADAFRQISEQNEGTWAEFIETCRNNKEMIDDDCTALILLFFNQAGANSVPLEASKNHPPSVISARKKAFEQARKDGLKDLVAIYYGDGTDLKAQVGPPDLEIKDARAVGDALREVVQALGEHLNAPNFRAKVQPVWEEYADLLREETCARGTIQALKAQGIHTDPGPAPMIITEPEKTADQTMQPRSEVGHFQSREPLEQQALKIALLEALVEEDDFAIVAAWQAILSSKHGVFFPPTLKQQQRIRLAEQRTKALDHLRDALQYSSAERMVKVYEADREFLVLASSDELAQVALAHQFCDAWESNEDRLIAIAYQKIYQSPFKDRFDFSEQAERIRRARDLELLEEALKTRKAAELAAAYDLLKDEIVMSQQELQPLAVVAAFTQALSNGPDEAITAAYQVLQTSVYRTAFDLTDSEKQRLKEALTQAPPPSAEEVNPPKPAALVNNNPIYEATLTKACIITGPYIQYRLQQLPYVEYSASNLEEKMDLQAQSEHLNDRRLVLEVLIDNWLIGFETERLRREGVVFFLWDDKAAANFEATFKDFKAFILNKYPEVVTEKQITDHDLKIFLDIFFRRHSFIRYLRNLPQPMALNKWIGAQRKNATIKYPNEEEKKRFTGGLMIPKFRRDQKPETQS